MSDTEVVRISGAPGCGKTTRLMDHVATEKHNGRSLRDIYYVTFSRSAVEETREELGRIFDPEDDDDLDSAGRTFHSLALQLVRGDLFEDLSKQIIERRSDPAFYEDFAERHGLNFDPAAVDPARPGEVDNSGTPDGNRFFDVYDQLQLRCLDPEDVGRIPIELPRSPERTGKIIKGWEHRKMAGRPDTGLPVYEHSDYVHECVERGYAPPADVLFIDEFQDLSPLEYRLYKTWRDSGELDRIYIAGDPNQSIYGSFRAARPEFFAETPVDDEERLRRSWRCPAEVVAVARQVLDADPSGGLSDFAARETGGRVQMRSLDTPTALAADVSDAAVRHRDGDGNPVFVLARTNYQVQSVARALRDAGVPHTRLGARDAVWDETMGNLLVALKALRDGYAVSGAALKTLFDNLPGRRESRIGDGDTRVSLSLLRADQGLGAEDVWSAFPDAAGVLDITPMLDIAEWRRDALDSALGATNGIGPDDVRIGTIHSAKGLEAASVYLFANSAPQVMERYNAGETAEEHRLYYVGVTRAAEELTIVRDFFDDETFPVFERFSEPQNPGEVVV